MNNTHSGLLIALEGIDGSGKTLLAKNLYTALLSLKKQVLITKEPAGTVAGETIYNHCINSTLHLTPKAQFLLFAASRAEHFDKVVIPHLTKNYIILSDRMADSSLVYQGYAQGLSIEMLKTINAWVMNDIRPDLTLYVRIDLATASERIQQRNVALDIFEQKQTFLQTSIAGFDALYEGRNDVIILDGTQDPETLTTTALYHILNHQKQS